MRCLYLALHYLKSRFFYLSFSHCLFPLAFVFVFGLWSAGLHAQHASLDALWTRIAPRLNQLGGDTTYQFIVDDIKAHCGGDINCLLLTYDTIRVNLERKFDLPAAIKATSELIRVAEQQGLTDIMGQGHQDLSRYYDALRQARPALIHADLALRYFEQTGNKREAINIKYFKINLTTVGSFDHAPIGEIESLVREAIAEKDSVLAGEILIYLIQRVYLKMSHPFGQV